MLSSEDGYEGLARYQHPSNNELPDVEAKRAKFVIIAIGVVLLIAFRTFLLADAIIGTLFFGYLTLLYSQAPSRRVSRRELQIARRLMRNQHRPS